MLHRQDVLFRLLQLLILLTIFIYCRANESIISKNSTINSYEQRDLSQLLINYIQSADQTRCSTDLHEQWNDAVAFRYKSAFRDMGDCFPPQYFIDHPTHHGPSGPGSSLHATTRLRTFISRLIEGGHVLAEPIHSIFDAPCGDWVWMQHVDLQSVVYIGGDITDVTIEQNTRCFQRDNVHFHKFDLTCMIPPPVDLMITRDVLFHMTDDLVLQTLRNIAASKVRYFLSTTFLDLSNAQNAFNQGAAYTDTLQQRGAESLIGYRHINLLDAPFCLSQPVALLKEVKEDKRHLGLWKLPFEVGNCN